MLSVLKLYQSCVREEQKTCGATLRTQCHQDTSRYSINGRIQTDFTLSSCSIDYNKVALLMLDKIWPGPKLDLTD